MMKLIRILSRLIVGSVFVFSGFVKGLDPMGTMFKIEDYFIAYNTEWAMPLALTLSILLSAVEFSVGILLILNARPKIVTWVLLLMMSGFTVMTFFDALYNPVPDCGCFGDAIILTNWQTFYKNIVLMVFVFVIIFTGKVSKPLFKLSAQNVMAVLVFVLFIAFGFYSYNRLPVIDFREWKVGNNMAPDENIKPKTYLVYQNKNTGETKEYLSEDLPWQDSVWMNKWEYSDTRIDDSMVPKTHELQIIDNEGIDHTDLYLYSDDYQFILTVYDLEKASKNGLENAMKVYRYLDEHGYSFIMLTSALKDETDQFSEKYDVDFNIFNADDIVLKTMVRSNPGLIVFKNGVVLNKWHYQSFPDENQLKELLEK